MVSVAVNWRMVDEDHQTLPLAQSLGKVESWELWDGGGHQHEKTSGTPKIVGGQLRWCSQNKEYLRLVVISNLATPVSNMQARSAPLKVWPCYLSSIWGLLYLIHRGLPALWSPLSLQASVVACWWCKRGQDTVVQLTGMVKRKQDGYVCSGVNSQVSDPKIWESWRWNVNKYWLLVLTCAEDTELKNIRGQGWKSVAVDI